MQSISVVNYDSQWPRMFEEICASVEPAIGKTALAIEHVGSTAVPGLCAKPVIDIDVVVDGDTGVCEAISKLETIGYRHLGNLGIKGREAFDRPPNTHPHHLYVCPQGSLGLRNHLAIRNYLRKNDMAARAYGDLKQNLARRFPNDIDAYVDGKTEFLVKILESSEFAAAEIESIRKSNLLES